MAVTTTFKQECPSCETMITIKESMVGKKVECTKCKDKFIAERPDDDDDEADDKPAAKKDTKLNGKKGSSTTVNSKTPAPAGKRPKLDVEDEDDEDEPDTKSNGKNGAKAPSKGKPQSTSRDEDDEDEEDDEDSTKKKKVKAGAGSNKLIIGLGLAVVGVVILVIAAVVVMSSGKTVAKGGPGGAPPMPGEQKGDGDKLPVVANKGEFKQPDAIAAPLSDVVLAQLSNFLPGDTEHVFHVFTKDLFHANSPLREAAFATPGALDDADMHKKLGFSVLAIDDLICAEKYTAPSWKYTVLHFKDPIKEEELKAALKLDTVKIDGQTVYKSTKSHPWFDQLAQFTFGVPNQIRFFDARLRDKPSFIRIHNAQTLIIGDEMPVKAFMMAKGQFALQSIKQTPVITTPAGIAGATGMPPPGGMMGGTLPPMTGTMMGGPPPMPGTMMGGPPPMPGTMMGGPPPMPGTMMGSTMPPISSTMMGASGMPPMPGTMMGGPPPMPGTMMGGPPPISATMMGASGMPPPGGMIGGNPNPAPIPVAQREEMYMTIKPSLKAILDRMESRLADSKDKVLFSSATDMDANRIDSKEIKDRVLRRPRQVWDVTILLNENKPRIRNLGTAFTQKETTLKYQLRNELICAQKIDAEQFQSEMMDHTAYQVAKFIQTLTRHEVKLPTVEQEKPAVPKGPPGFPQPGVPYIPPMPGGPMQPEIKVEEKKADPNFSRISLNQQSNTVEFLLDLVLDNPAQSQVLAITTLVASALRGEMEGAADASLRHALGNAGKLLGEKGLTEREIAPGRFPPGAFKRNQATLYTDREPRNRISWMAGLLPYMGQQNLYNKIQFQNSWRDPANWMAGGTVVPQFLDPMYPDYSRKVGVVDLPLDFGATHFVGIAGVGMDAAAFNRNDLPPNKRGVLGYDESLSLDEVGKGRGTSNTILMIQVPHDGVTGVSPWIAGGGATHRGVPEKNSIAPFLLSKDRNGNAIHHQNKRGTYVLMTDGSVRFVDENVSDDVFKAMATVGDPTTPKIDLNKVPNTQLIPATDEPKDAAPPLEKQPLIDKKPLVEKQPQVEKKSPLDQPPVDKKPLIEKEPAVEKLPMKTSSIDLPRNSVIASLRAISELRCAACVARKSHSYFQA